MGKRYYCDYCDRSFKDDPEARRKHLISLQHIQNRTNHYNYFKDAETILQEETLKTPCKRFMTIGDCAFGNGCRFSHYTPPMIWELQRLVAWSKQASTSAMPKEGWPDPDEVAKEFFQDIIDSDMAEEIEYPNWTFPAELRNFPNLPPSLWPITLESVTDSNFGKWS
ncbi:zinc finger matrin-type protein 5 [Prorops nasuta]|uniref:zinc finger matrin-type protein 5 n=1 Tax=Prorops nasuta TaxID=863751 RepID=UPI0034CFA9DF